MFQTTKIQTFESNSQQIQSVRCRSYCCFRLQRYKLLKAIHNDPREGEEDGQLFQTTKIQTFESNSQLGMENTLVQLSCFRLQRYKLLKAIHNYPSHDSRVEQLFQTTKIQTFESNSQPV